MDLPSGKGIRSSFTMLRMKSNQKMFMKNFLRKSICFDFRNFSNYSMFYDNQNEMVIGKIKHQYRGILINRYVGLKSKMHPMLSDDGKESATAKRLSSVTQFNQFKYTLFNKKIMRHKMKRIQSKEHKMGTCEINKIALLCFDDKRSVLNDGIHTHACSHKELRQ